ncbi:transcriptional regulator AsnC family [Vibrio coralliilyticus ATCC BAA-450]|nr:transcriptional regulator AsnC family [Vibrio coralliilyticus ATCC BAA-450]
MLVVSVPDIKAYEKFIERVLHQDKNIRKFQTSVSTRTVKFSTEVNVEEIQ